MYSSWYRLHTVAKVCALSLPKCLANSWAIEAVESNVPYKSNAMMMFFPEDMELKCS